jgi:hypothetical protein
MRNYICTALLLCFNTFLLLGSDVFEKEIIPINLNKDIAVSEAEFSGMDWFKDKLILLPQYPDRFPSKFDGCLFSISKSEIENYLYKKHDNPLKPVKIELDSKGIEKQIKGFQGYEAIAFKNNIIYLTIEAENSGQMFAYILKGEIDSTAVKITLTPNSLKEIPLPVNLENMAIETLLIVNDKVVTIYEANGKNVNSHPFACSFDLELQTFDLLHFPNIEYRITDATRIDDDYSFWGINYLYKGDYELLNPALDIISEKYGKRSQNQVVERIIKFMTTDNQIKLKDEAPIQIKLSEDSESRNWEGIVKYDSLGFLMITDKFPKTILAYIPYSLGINDLFVFEKAGKFGFHNSLEIEIINPQYIFAQEFLKFGIAAVVDDSGWVYINKYGKKIIRPHVVDNGPDYFSYGLARFKLNNMFGYFNEQGIVSIKPQFDFARPFADSLAAVCYGCQLIKKEEVTEINCGKWGFIDLKGELIIPFIYNSVEDFKNGNARVKQNGKSITIQSADFRKQ